MLWKASEIRGYTIKASDGPLGTVSDFLFDDARWLVRWLVVDTGTWLSGRKVLLPAFVLGHIDSVAREFSVRLTKEQVKDSPDIDTEKPVSRQMESGIYDYYGWSPYWGTGFYMGGALAMPPPLASEWSTGHLNDGEHSHDDPHLRSTDAVSGYHIHATDGEVGHVDDFLIEDADWSIHYLVVDTKNWWPGKKVLISPRSALQIDWMDRLVNLDVNRQRVKDSPAYDPSLMIDRVYERNYHAYYSQPGTEPVGTQHH